MPVRWLGGIVGAAVALTTVLSSPALASNDPFFDRQWALEQIGAPRAWTVTRGAGVVIGVVDSGVEATHADLVGKVALTADCVGRAICLDGAGNADPDGHGTRIVGVAAAGTDNGRGIAGVAPDARVVVARVLGPGGTGRAEDINLGIRWAVDHGARVVNISLGDPGAVASTTGSPLRAGIDYAWSHGAVPVLAAGNYGGLNSENYGALNALVVGATDRTGTVASYSSGMGNAKWALVAPGGSGQSGPDNNIISTTVGGGYAASAGTSMAAPHVSGAVALLLAQGLSPSAAVAKLLATLDRVPCGAGCQGRLNVGVATGGRPVAAAPPTVPAVTAAVQADAATTTTTEAPAPSSTVAPAPAPAPVVPPAPAPAADQRAGAQGAEVEPESYAAAPRPLSSAAHAVNPLVASVAVGLLLAMGVSVAGVWAQRRMGPAPVRRGA